MAPNNENNRNNKDDDKSTTSKATGLDALDALEIEEEGVKATAMSLLKTHKQATDAITVVCNGKTHTTSWEAKQAMSMAIEASCV